MASSDQQRGDDDSAHCLDGQRAPADRGALGHRRGVLRAGVHDGRRRDGLLRRGCRVTVP